jgi:hypothetical protein
MSAKRLTTLFAASITAVLASGCIFADDDVDPGDPLNAYFFLTWETVDATTGLEVDCVSAGAKTVRTIASNVTTGEDFVDLFDCRATQGSSYLVTAGTYSVTVELLWCADRACLAPEAVSSAFNVGSYGVYRDMSVDLGHFVFTVN